MKTLTQVAQCTLLLNMEFEWDDAEEVMAASAERGFDFVYAIRVFLDPRRLNPEGNESQVILGKSATSFSGA